MRGFGRILLVCQQSKRDEAAVECAVNLAVRAGAHLMVVDTVREVPADVKSTIAAIPARDLDKLVMAERAQALKAFIQPFQREGLKLDTGILTGTPFLEIIKKVIRDNHDLVMITAEGRSGLRDRLLGDTSMHLMRKCPCPVWVVKPTRRRFRRILAAVDTAPEQETQCQRLNEKIMDVADNLATMIGAELHVVHAWRFIYETFLMNRAGIPPAEVGRYVRDVSVAHQHELERLLEGYSTVADWRRQVHFLKGDPATIIPALTRRKGFELVVMGTVGRAGIAGLLIGNTAERILQQADCSVLGVKPEGFTTPVKV
jgi:nucleotide-binding universal stress UspA family protein